MLFPYTPRNIPTQSSASHSHFAALVWQNLQGTPLSKPKHYLALCSVGLLAFMFAFGVACKSTWAQTLFPTAKTKAIIAKAKAGSAKAQTDLGQLYYFGEGGLKLSHERAREWYQKALAQNSPRAKYALSGMYFRGEGGDKDRDKAFALTLEAAKQGLPEAQLNVGKKLSRGDGIARNHTHAHAWLTLAAENGSLLAHGLKDILANSMTAKQRSQAADLAEKWRKASQ